MGIYGKRGDLLESYLKILTMKIPYVVKKYIYYLYVVLIWIK